MNRKGISTRLFPIIIISLVLGSAAYSWNSKNLGGNQMPMPFGLGVSVVLSGSMEPAVRVNDLVIVKRAESYMPGDVVVYQTGSILVIHRLVDTDGTTAITKGDANNTEDPPIPVYSIRGKMIARIPGAGVMVQLLQSLPARLGIIGLSAYFMLRSRRIEQEEEEAQRAKLRKEIEILKDQMRLEEIQSKISKLDDDN